MGTTKQPRCTKSVRVFNKLKLNTAQKKKKNLLCCYYHQECQELVESKESMQVDSSVLAFGKRLSSSSSASSPKGLVRNRSWNR